MRYIDETQQKLARRTALIPWHAEELTGAERVAEALQGV
jgi:hypothetical protein